ncbi:MAG: glycosyltransferase family 2 protein [Acidobacteria bacterium]|nr:glycosyltransferase family 2 protein [Acidobacteriota bacterium]
MNLPSTARPSTCAIVVSFYPGPHIVQNVAALLQQVERVFVIDNGSVGNSLEHLHALRGMPLCHVHLLGENLGIAAAMNQGVKLAVDGGFKSIFTFDQDSSITPGFVVKMLAEYDDACRKHKKVGLVFPQYFDSRSGMHLRTVLDKNGDPYTAMTSGNLVLTEVFQECGGFEEAFFMDYVDHEFCLRLRNHGYSIVECANAILLHSLGNLRTYKIVGLEFGCTHHNAGRRYYITRNRIYIYRKFLHSNWGWCKHDILSSIQELVKLVIFEEQKVAKLRNIWRGIRDGISGRMGKTVNL